MKSIIIFGTGCIAGVIATLLTLFLIYGYNQTSDDLSGLTLFPDKGEYLPSVEKLEIFHVIEPNMALARTGDYPDGILVLVVNHDGRVYYDDQTINIPTGQGARQIGIYRYTSRDGSVRTVPVVIVE